MINLRSGVLLLLLLGPSIAAWPSADDQAIEARLARWLISNGALLSGFSIGRECPTCLRGVVATKDLAPNEVIMKIPFSAMIRFPADQTGYPAELARSMLLRMHTDPAFNATFSLFWQAHPAADEAFTPELYTDEQLDNLQTPELEAMARRQRDTTEEVFYGSYGEPPYAPMIEVLPAVTVDTFKHAAAMLNSRAFGFNCDETETEVCTHLVPLLDLLNHSDDPNAERTGDSKLVTLAATRHIRRGEAITHNYFEGVIHRPDMSMFYFGFVAEREVPLLPAVDLPDFNEDDPFAATPPDDSRYDDPDGEFVTAQEHARLSARLAAAATTLEEDEALLAGGTVKDWRDNTILRYRIARKRALTLAIDKIAAVLGLGVERAVDADVEHEL